MLLCRGKIPQILCRKTSSDKERYVFALNAVWECVLNPAKYQVEG